MSDPVYLDYNATTPMDPRVLEAMIPWFLTPSNAGSRTHSYGQAAREAVEKARRQVADVLNAKPEEIFFTSGATESNNIAILGLTEHGEKTCRKHIISTEIEHKAVLEPLEQMRRRGFEVDLAPVTSGGYVEPDAIKRLLRKDTLLVSVMHANNETGVLQPVEEISKLVAETQAVFHTDASQTFGKEVETLCRLKCDMLSISGHKIFGPQGAGALYARSRGPERRHVAPISFGGGQERGLRAGTIPVALVVGLGIAADLARAEHAARQSRAVAQKNELLSLIASLPFQINGNLDRIQPHVLNLSFMGIDSEALMMTLKGSVAISNGSACTSSLYSPSYVLKAMGLDEGRTASAVRISWGPGDARKGFLSIADAVRSLNVL
jgi:cysteine desulfurase